MNALALAVDDHLLDVDVRLEGAVRSRCPPFPLAGVLVADVAAERRALTANLTFCRHSSYNVAGPAMGNNRDVAMNERRLDFAGGARRFGETAGTHLKY